MRKKLDKEKTKKLEEAELELHKLFKEQVGYIIFKEWKKTLSPQDQKSIDKSRGSLKGLMNIDRILNEERNKTRH